MTIDEIRLSKIDDYKQVYQRHGYNFDPEVIQLSLSDYEFVYNLAKRAIELEKMNALLVSNLDKVVMK